MSDDWEEDPPLTERDDYPQWKARQDWYDSTMIGHMLNSLWDGLHFKTWHPTDEELEAFWRWFDDVDLRTGMYGK